MLGNLLIPLQRKVIDPFPDGPVFDEIPRLVFETVRARRLPNPPSPPAGGGRLSLSRDVLRRFNDFSHPDDASSPILPWISLYF